MDLRDRLEKIEGLKNRVQQISHNHRERKLHIPEYGRAVSISEILAGNMLETPYGSIFYTEKIIPLHTSFGNYSLAKVKEYFPAKEHAYITKSDSSVGDIRLNQALFFDTETTGLAGGAGTYIFLMGLGYFTREAFCVRQYFMSDYHEEEAFLWAINQLFAQDFKLLVSYNGKCYDFPLMQTRFIMSRLPLQLNNYQHLDLLFPARRLWKRRLRDCSLSNIERRILNISRNEDIPGYLIPHVYFRYLQDKDARSLKPIFSHNLQDIISLVILAAKIGQVLREPFHASRGNNGIDLYSIGRIYEINKDYEYSSRCYEEALNCDLTDEDSLEILRLCSYAYKKQGNWQRAERAWRDIISFSNEFILFPYEELAKYYEHRLKDYSRAINVVEDALTRLEQENLDLENKGRWMQELNYRLERIIRKSNACNQNSSGI
jgi:hypothetical protein